MAASGFSAHSGQAPPPRTITGQLVYLRQDDTVWGRESFSITEHRQGRTYRSCMEMDDFGIFREANWSMSPDWRPLEGFSRETVDGETAVHAWYRIDGNDAEVEVYSNKDRRASRRLAAQSPIGHLGLHVILSDCMVSAGRGFDDVGAEKPVVCLANSLDGYGRGAAEPVLVRPLVTYLGSERINVAIGEMNAEHFMVRWSDVVPTHSHFWVTRDHFIPVRMDGASGPVRYELAELNLG